MQWITRAEAKTLILTITIVFHSQCNILSLFKAFKITIEVGTFVDADCTFNNKGSFVIHSLHFDSFRILICDRISHSFTTFYSVAFSKRTQCFWQIQVH